MNRIYKVIWNKTKGCYAVASEIAKQHSHSSANHKKLVSLLTVAFLLSGAVGVSAADLTADQQVVYNAVMEKIKAEMEAGKFHYFSVKSKINDTNSNHKNNGARGENSLAIGPSAIAGTEKSISIGHNAHIDGSGGNGNHTGISSVAIGDNALITTNGLDLTSIAIGKNAKVLNGSGKQERVLSFTPGNYKGGCSFFGCDTMPIDADKLAGGIAIGANSYARTASVQIGSHTMVGYKMGGVEITKYTNDNEANILGMTTIGTNSYNKGAMASMLGAYSIITGGFDGSGGFNSVSYGPQNFGASVVGALNSIRSKGHGKDSGVANSIVGLGNIAEDANGTLIFGAGNKISHSTKTITGFNATMGDAKGVDEVVDNLQKGIKESKSGGAVLAIGGGNTADYVQHSQIIGVNNTVKGKSSKISNFNLVDGYENTVEDSNHVTVLGSENEITNGEHHVVIGDKRKVVGAKKTVIIGSSTFKKEIKASKAVIVGHEAEVKVDGGVALGYNSIANVDKGVFGYDPISGKALTSEDELRASMGEEEIKKLEDAVNNAKNDLDAKKATAKEKEDAYKTAKTGYDSVASMVDDATKKALLANIEKLKKEAEDAKKPIEEAQKAYNKAVKAKDGIVFAWKSGLAAVSVGNAETGETRQITGVAAGTEDTDAVNVAQLKKVEKKIDSKGESVHYFSVNSTDTTENSNYKNDRAKQKGGIAVGPNANTFGRHGSALGSSAFSIGELSTAIGGHAVAAVEDGITKEKYDALSDEEKKNYVFHFLGESDGDSRHDLSLYYKTNFKTYTNEEFKKLSKDEREKLTKEEGYGYFEGEDKWMSSPRALAVGYRAKAIGKATVAIGNMTEATKYQATAIGVKAKASGEYSFAASDNAKASGEGSISIGHHTEAAGQWSTAVGSWAEAKGQYGIAAGVEATANKKNTSAFGFRAKATTSESTAIGTMSEVTGNGGVSIGYVAKTESDYGVALGAYSVANRERHAVGYLADGETNATWKASMGAVSVGNEQEGYTRQIIGVAAGTKDTDAVNVAQLKNVEKKIDSKGDAIHYFSVKSKKQSDGSNYKNDGAKAEGAIVVGVESTSEGVNGVVLGNNNTLTGIKNGLNNSIVAGNLLSVDGVHNVVIGTDYENYDNKFTKVAGEQNTVIGVGNLVGYTAIKDKNDRKKWIYSKVSEIGSDQNVVLGLTNTANGGSVVVGTSSEVEDGGMSFGQGNKIIGSNDNHGGGQRGVALGSFLTVKGEEAVAIGRESQAVSDWAIAVGKKAIVKNIGSVAIGIKSQALADWSVSLGSYSKANRKHGSVGYLADGQNTIIWKANLGAVAVGDVKTGYTRQIIGVAAGTEDTDAVNVAQLKKLAKSIEKDTNTTYTLNGADNKDGTTTLTLTGSDGKEQKVTVASKEAVKNYVEAHQTTVAGDDVTGVKVAATTEKDKGTTYKVSLDENVKVGNISINGKKEGEEPQGTITGLTNTTWDPEKIVSGRAATEDQLKLATAKMETFVQDFHPTSVTAGENISVKKGNATAGGDEYTVSLAKNLKGLSSVETQIIKVGDKEKPDRVTINKTGLRIKGGPNITTNGIDADNKRITKVADGKDLTDAVNMKQLGEVKKGVDTNTRAISSLGTRMNRSTAGAAALAALHPLDFDPDEKLDLAAGYGNYNGAHAAALGAYYRPNEDTMISVGASLGGGENIVNAGVSVKLGQGNHVSTSRVAMAKEMIAMKDHILQLEATIAQMKGFMATMTGEDRRTDLFPDVPENHWAYEYIKGLQEKGIIEGYPDGNFNGDRHMTRYEFAAMLYRALMKGVKLDARIVTEFAPELGRIRVDVISKDKNGVPDIERVRVNPDFK